MTNKFIPKVIIFTVLIFLFSTVAEPFLAFANTPNQSENFEDEFFGDEPSLGNLTFEDLDKLSDEELEDLGVITGDDADEFNPEILDDDFDFEAAVDNLDISKMNEDEKEKFLQLVEETAAISGTDEVELLEEALVGIFDGNSETFNDLETAHEQLIENYVEKVESEEIAKFSKAKELIFGSEAVYAASKKKGKVRVGNNFAGAVFNVAISGVVGGGVSAVKKYIAKKGKKKAADAISRVATAQAKKLNIKTIAGKNVTTVVATAVYIALDYTDVGGYIARFIDSKDWYKNNGWIDITK